MQKQKESLSVSTAKLVMVVSLIVGIGSIVGVLGYYLTKQTAVSIPFISPLPKTISAIEISSDAKSILNAETKKVIFTIDDANKYLKDSEYAYNPDTFQITNAKYEGDCFLSAVLSNNKDRIVFSTGCLPWNLPQPWIGTYFTDYYEIHSKNNGRIYSQARLPIKFLIGGSGRNFAWSSDDKTITYEADLGLSGMTETRTIDAGTGEVVERKIETEIDASDWLIYDSTADAEYYYERYKIKYPRELFYKPERAKSTHTLATFFEDKFNKIKFSIEVLPEKIGELAYDARNYYVRNIKIENNDFQELKDNKTGALSYIYKTGYSDKNHNGDFYIIFDIFDPNSEEDLIVALGTVNFLGNVKKKEAIIGADEGSWKQVYKNEKYGFQLKAQNGFDIIDKLDDNMSLIFVGGPSNIYLSLSLLSGVSTAEEWLDRELTINEYAPKKSEREYYRIGNSDEIGIMVDQADNNGELKNHVFYVTRGQYLYSISAPLVGTNEFAYARMVSNFRFLEPSAKLIGLKSKWGLSNVFEFNAESGKLERTLNEKDFVEKGYEWKDVKWYETKIAGIVPMEIRSFFPTLEINPQGSMDMSGWSFYRDKNDAIEFFYPKEWKLEDYSALDNLYFNVKKEKENPALPRVIIFIDRNPIPTETLSIVGDVSIVKFNGIEALAMTMYGEKGETDPYSYTSSDNTYFIEFHDGLHDYYIEYHFNGGSYNLQEFNTFLSSMRINQ